MRPVNGPITSPYGYRINGRALLRAARLLAIHVVDMEGRRIGPVRALVRYFSAGVSWLFLNLGLINGKNVTVIYNHLSAYRTHVGQAVARGQVVGLIGTTGWSTGCHTHMTVMVNGVAVNPRRGSAEPHPRGGLESRAVETNGPRLRPPGRMAGCRRSRGAS
jgi:murein DD-endopeptidase MepM/ murein hydrolase activator NlpD